MTAFKAKRASRTHAHTVTTLLLSLKQYVRLFGSRQEGLRSRKRVVGRPGEPPLSLQMSNITLNHSNPPTAPTLHNDDGTTPKADDNCEDKHQGSP